MLVGERASNNKALQQGCQQNDLRQNQELKQAHTEGSYDAQPLPKGPPETCDTPYIHTGYVYNMYISIYALIIGYVHDI